MDGKPAFSPVHGTGLRQPPSNLEAEQALLGAIMANPKAYESVRHFLKPEHFFDPAHQVIYRTAQAIVDAGRVADTITLRTALEHNGELAQAGGVQYLVTLLSAMVAIASAPSYGRLILDCWTRREVIYAAEALLERAHDGDPILNTESLIRGGLQSLHEVSNKLPSTGRRVSLGKAADEALAAAERAYKSGGVVGMPTGFYRVDDVIVGMEDGGLYLLGARPGVGKSALAVQVALRAGFRRIRAARAGEADLPKGRIFMASLEMQADQLAARAMVLASHVPLHDLRTGAFYRPERSNDKRLLMDAREQIYDIPLRIEDTPQVTIAQIERQAEATRRELGGLDCVIVDHLHIVGREETARRFGDTQAVGEISRGLKAMAKRMGVPVLALCQLSRGVESREDKRPTLQDLRQAGDLEQDADGVLFLYRHDYYLGDQPPGPNKGEQPSKHQERCQQWADEKRDAAGKAEVIIAKNRHGKSNVTAVIGWDGARVRFVDTPEDVNQQNHQERG